MWSLMNAGNSATAICGRVQAVILHIRSKIYFDICKIPDMYSQDLSLAIHSHYQICNTKGKISVY